jgi:hypothetical protein
LNPNHGTKSFSGFRFKTDLTTENNNEVGQIARTEGKYATVDIVGFGKTRLNLSVTIHVTKFGGSWSACFTYERHLKLPINEQVRRYYEDPTHIALGKGNTYQSRCSGEPEGGQRVVSKPRLAACMIATISPLESLTDPRCRCSRLAKAGLLMFRKVSRRSFHPNTTMT